MSTNLITVFGATGSQGGSLINSILKNKRGMFTLRGITRDVWSSSSTALAARGVEMRQANCFRKDQVVEALKGSWGVFANTNSEDPAVMDVDGPSDTDVGKIIVDAAVEAGVKHFVYSGLPSSSKITNGSVSSQIFEEKYLVGEYAKSKNFDSVTIVGAGWYMENLMRDGMARIVGGFALYPDEEGYLTFQSPRWGGNEEIPFVAIADDYGDFVHGVFLDPNKYHQKFIQGFSQSATATQLVETFQKVTGKKSRYVVVEDWTTFHTSRDQTAQAIRNMFGFCQLSGGLYYGTPNDLTVARELKAAVAEAQGEASSELMSLERFIGRSFST